MELRCIALLQARTDSTRLPKKVLKKVLDKELILHQLERTSNSQLIDDLILVTSNEQSDDELVHIVTQVGFQVYRGDKNNVLKRFYDALLLYDLNDNDIIVRLTGDCPLHDGKIIDESIKSFKEQNCDYLANCVKPVYPDGFDVEVFNYKSLIKAYLNAQTNTQKEHVTPYIREDKELVVKDLEQVPVHNDWRLTVDEPKDFELISKIFEKFNSNQFSFESIIKFLEINPELLNINRHINRNEGYIKSLNEEKNMQGKVYIEEDADQWFDRNTSTKHNCFTEYLMELFPKSSLKTMNLAEFGVGRANNVNLLSHFVNLIDGYDGSKKSIEMVELLRQRASNVNGKRVNLGSEFEQINDYDLIIYGFFTYMISDDEFRVLLKNSKEMLREKGYIFIYDFLSEENKNNIDAHNNNLKVFKRNLDFYIKEFSDFQLIDFRLFDNRNLKQYLDNDNITNIDTSLDSDDYNWTFSALFKLK